MLHLLIKKTSQYLIISAFTVFAVSAIHITHQVQKEHNENLITTHLAKKETIATITKKTNNPTKTDAETDSENIIYISNFPVKAGHISSRYGMRKDPFTGKRKMHKGIDIAAKSGTSVYPIGEGKVIFSGTKAGFGRLIEIKHSKTVISRYSHLKKILVKKGQIVTTANSIGQVGSSGRSTGPHLHLEIAFNGETANPREFLSREVAGTQ